jgi:hypothetical protein
VSVYRYCFLTISSIFLEGCYDVHSPQIVTWLVVCALLKRKFCYRNIKSNILMLVFKCKKCYYKNNKIQYPYE